MRCSASSSSTPTPRPSSTRSAPPRASLRRSPPATRPASTRPVGPTSAKVESSSDNFILIVGGLIALLYVTSLVIVRIGQRFIDRQALAQAEAARREQLWHREKMAALSTMAANVAHEVGNPLAVIQGVAAELPEAERGAARQIRAQGERIARMMRQIADFAAARSEAPEWVDVNALVKAICDFLAFDRRFRGLPIEFQPGEGLPACELVPDHLNEVLMNLLQACADEEPRRFAQLRVETRSLGGGVQLRIGGAGGALGEWWAQPRLAAVRRRIAEMGANARVSADAIEIDLLSPTAP
ncbi:hypothetical protein FSC37_19185 [Piscinibacter aquaticus]|uniref:histidine kinase n=1 Tax=Piscinibacter aquaticus TaxID=392597 RepID=A0A5C6U2Q8_9BURK|nr:hypothetical protein FSC37_19185 [Piscinibacter aquaticus]